MFVSNLFIKSPTQNVLTNVSPNPCLRSSLINLNQQPLQLHKQPLRQSTEANHNENDPPSNREKRKSTSKKPTKVNTNSGHKTILSQPGLSRSTERNRPNVQLSMRAVQLKMQIEYLDEQIDYLKQQRSELEQELQYEILNKPLSKLRSAESLQPRMSDPNIKSFSPPKGNFIGSLVDNMKTGFGTLTDNEGQVVYEGEWKNDKYEGRGRLYNHSQKGSIKIEELLKNLKVFKIAQQNPQSWKSYEGNFVNGQFNGLGILLVQEGLKFHGNFKDGEAQGRGTLVNTKNKQVHLVGDFEDGYLISTQLIR